MLKRIKLRTLFIGGLFLVLFIIIVCRLFWYQVINQDFWMDQAKATWSTNKELPAKRGTIFDQNGNILAMDAPAYNVTVNPKVIQELRTDANLVKDRIDVEALIVQELSKLLGKKEAELYDLVRKKRDDNGEYHIYREVRPEGWKIDQETYDKLNAFIEELQDQTGKKDIGLNLLDDSKRYYPKDTLASHVLGYMDREGKAVGGIESQFDSILQGVDGSLMYEKDRKGTKLPTASEVYKPAADGKNIYLTIDRTIQQYIEESIKEVYDKYNPASISVIAADPTTGEILGLANAPTFNPNNYWDYASNMSSFYNPAIMGTYEPGSTFKIVTLAAAVQEGLFDPEALFKSGSIKAGGRTIPDHNKVGWGTISYLEGLKRSSNVAFVKLGFEMLKEERFKSYIDKFGFGVKAGIELPGESSGEVRFTYAADVAAAAYGHGQTTVTLLQQIMAVSAVANGGTLLKPTIVKKIEDPATGEVEVTKPQAVHEVLDKQIAKQVGEYLEQVVSDQEIGTGKAAYIDGYRVAGKTGTALIINEDGVYDAQRARVSFVGYAPVNDPKIAVIVMVNDPQDYYGGGGFVAPIIFKDIVSKSLRYMNVPTTHEMNEQSSVKGKDRKPGLTKAPNIQGLKPVEAKKRLAEKGIAFETVGNGTEVLRQYPEPGSTLSSGQRIYLLTEETKKLKLPNLTGKSLRDVMEICSLMEWEVQAEGEGYVVGYDVSTKDNKRVVHVKLAPKSP